MFDKFITINYPHSYGGDFLANLIMRNEMVITDNGTTTYTTPGVVSSHGVKNLDIIIGLWRNKEYRDYFFNQDTVFAKRQVNYFNILFDSDESKFKTNIIDDLRSKLNHLIDSINVFSTHHVYGNQSFLPLSEIFPRSTNLALSLDNPNNKLLYEFFLKKKALEHYNNTSIYYFYRDRSPVYMKSDILVYMDRLLFENGYSYASQIEDMLGVEFRLDSLDAYRDMQKKILIDNGLRYETMFDW